MGHPVIGTNYWDLETCRKSYLDKDQILSELKNKNIPYLTAELPVNKYMVKDTCIGANKSM